VDTGAITKDEAFDGYYAIKTNELDLKVLYQNEKYLLKTKALELSRKILNALSIKPFKNILPLKEFSSSF